MAAHDATAWGASIEGNYIKYPYGQGRDGVSHIRLDFAEVVSYLGAAIDPATPDTLDLFHIPAGMMINGVYCEIETALVTVASGGSCTVTIGDEDSAAGYMASSDLKAAAATVYATVITDAYAVGNFIYTAEHHFRLTFAGTATSITSGVLDIYLMARMIDVATAPPGTWK